MVDDLKEQNMLVVDCEGVDLSNTGQLCFMQILSPSSSTVYLIDTVLLKTSDLVACGLVRLLENRQIKKIFFDARGDTGAMYNQLGINVQGILDLQVAEAYYRRRKHGRAEFVFGLSRTLDTYLHHTASASSKQIKDEGSALLKKSQYKAWAERPLPDLLLDYAANDVQYLLPLFDVLIGTAHPYITKEMLEQLSAKRCDSVRYNSHYDFSNKDLATKVNFL